MRLLNVSTLRFKEFFDESCPNYVILSHTWEQEETTFQAFSSLTFDASSASVIGSGATQGVEKVLTFCRLTQKTSEHEWVWVDTCCINKESSAELSEAINSMYRWYSDAQACYVYLPDVEITEDNRSRNGDMSTSRWFTRGWTLQELLAPREVIFFDANWEHIGSNEDLLDEIHEGSGIDRLTLMSIFSPLKSTHMAAFPIAKKMSWAANRQTRRKEDTAYCLLGLFGINMSLLYGEGDNAFLRLQKKIIKKYDDETIFAWSLPGTNFHQGLLAHHPSYFRESMNFIPCSRRSHPVSITNQGAQFQIICGFAMHQRHGLWKGESTILPLNCEVSQTRVGIILTYHIPGRWLRQISALVRLEKSFKPLSPHNLGRRTKFDHWRPLFVDLDCKGRLPISEDDRISPCSTGPAQFLRFNDQKLCVRSYAMSSSVKYLTLNSTTNAASYIRDVIEEIESIKKKGLVSRPSNEKSLLAAAFFGYYSKMRHE